MEFDQTKEEPGIWFATLMAGGFDHLGALRRELRGNQRTSCYVDERAATSSERVAVPPKRDSYAPRHEQSELLLAAAGALRSPLRRIASDVLLAACRDLGWAFGPGRTTRPDCQVPPTAAKKKGRLGRRPFKIVPLRRYGCFS